MSPELQKLIQLQDIDIQIFDLTDRHVAIPEERQAIEEQFRQEAADYYGIDEAMAEARASRKRIEADLADYEVTHEKFKADLMRVRNQKEYGTILREIDATRKSISTLETEALQLMEQIEQYEKDLAEQTPEFEKHRAEVDARLAELDQERERIEARIAELRAERERIGRDVAPNMMALYDRVARTRKGRALALAVGQKGGTGKCSACHMVLRPQIFSDIRRGEDLIVCDNCSRILFYRPTEETPLEANVS